MSVPSWQPDGWHTVTPRLVVADPERMVRFLIEAFEAQGTFDPQRPSMVRIGDSVVMVSGTEARGPTSTLLYVYVQDVDATYERALHAGATAVEEPSPLPYGDRRATITDPFGNNWQIATMLSS